LLQIRRKGGKSRASNLLELDNGNKLEKQYGTQIYTVSGQGRKNNYHKETKSAEVISSVVRWEDRGESCAKGK